jgi:hypothetical protein
MEGASQYKRGHNRITRLAEHEQGTSSKNSLSWSKGADTSSKQASFRINSLPAAAEERRQDGCPPLTPRDPGRRRGRSCGGAASGGCGREGRNDGPPGRTTPAATPGCDWAWAACVRNHQFGPTGRESTEKCWDLGQPSPSEFFVLFY